MGMTIVYFILSHSFIPNVKLTCTIHMCNVDLYINANRGGWLLGISPPGQMKSMVFRGFSGL